MCRRRSSRAILALALVSCTSSPSETEGSPTTTTSATPTERAKIEGLRIEEPRWRGEGDGWRLVLSWSEPPSVEIDHYEIARDGITIAEAVSSTVFQDEDVEPSARYRYVVVGVDAEGARTRDVAETIRTGEPPLAEARLDGTFAVRLHVVRSKGTRNPVRDGAVSFSFDPRCRSGPCAVRWRVRGTEAEGTLHRDRAVYARTLRAPLFVRNCFGRVVPETLDVRLRVTRAAPLGERWRATKIDGSIDEVSSSPGCRTATIHWSLRGSLQA